MDDKPAKAATPKKRKAKRRKRKPIENKATQKLSFYGGPGRGRKVPLDVRRAFAAEFLKTGSITASCRIAGGLPWRTGFDLSKEVEKEPGFAEARRHLRENNLARVEAMLLKAAETASERAEREGMLVGGSDKGPGIWVEKAPEYQRNLVDTYKAISMNRKGDAPATNSEPVQVEITVKAVPPEPDSGS